MRIESVFAEHCRDGCRFIQAATLDPYGLEQAIDESCKAFRVAQLHACYGAHEHQGVDREVGIEFQRHAVAFGVAVQILKHVAAFGRDSRRRGVTGGFEHSAQQERNVDQPGVGLRADLR
ncbi:hypothetical protein D3C81_1762220 [compost metagenome]